MTTTVAITSLTAGTVQGTDVYPAVDTTDITQASAGTTKRYLVSDLLAFVLTSSGFSVYSPVVASSTANLTSTYANGTLGVNRTLTNAGAQSAFTLDGITGVFNDRYLVKNQTNSEENGIYTLTTVGDGSTNWVLTGASDFNQVSNITNLGLVYVSSGTINDETMWQVSFTSPLTVGTTLLTWTSFDNSATTSFSWNVVSGTAQTIAMQNGYITSDVGLTTLTLPTIANVGEIFRIGGYGTGGWSISQNASQFIADGSNTTTTGVLGSLSSSNARDSVEIICVTANVAFLVLSRIGTLTSA